MLLLRVLYQSVFPMCRCSKRTSSKGNQFSREYPKCRCSMRASSHGAELVVNNKKVIVSVTAFVSVDDSASVRGVVIVIVKGIVSVSLSHVSML